jgi:DNA helicase HerA-like ATPase
MDLTLKDIAHPPRSRSFIVGTTGTGKSTLSAALLRQYKERHPHHLLYIVDPKRRFVPVEPDEEDPEDLTLFPHGTKERIWGRRTGVAVLAGRLDVLNGRHLWDNDTSFVVQDSHVVHQLMDWLYDNSDVRTPSLLYLDESSDMMHGSRADPSLRRLLQQGREIGCGAMIVNQRPAWIDRTVLTESDQLYVGTLDHEDDRKAISRVSPLSAQERLETPVSLHSWFFVNKRKPGKSRIFRHQLT